MSQQQECHSCIVMKDDLNVLDELLDLLHALSWHSQGSSCSTAGMPLTKASYSGFSVAALGVAAELIELFLERFLPDCKMFREDWSGHSAGAFAIRLQIRLGGTLAGLRVTDAGLPTAIFIVVKTVFTAAKAILQEGDAISPSTPSCSSG